MSKEKKIISLEREKELLNKCKVYLNPGIALQLSNLSEEELTELKTNHQWLDDQHINPKFTPAGGLSAKGNCMAIHRTLTRCFNYSEDLFLYSSGQRISPSCHSCWSSIN